MSAYHPSPKEVGQSHLVIRQTKTVMAALEAANHRARSRANKGLF
jgi:hypothetical protein